MNRGIRAVFFANSTQFDANNGDMTVPVTIAAVGYLNTAPLVEGLDSHRGITLIRAVPSRIAPMVGGGEADIGLISVVDGARTDPDLVLIPGGMIGCDGATLTVRLFSSVPIDRITRVHADTDSHTSVALCDVVLRDAHGVRAAFIDYDVREQRSEDDWPESVLMIGDKVVTGSPPAVRYPYQIDLGAAWKEMTGLPFVYAAWMCRREDMDAPRIRDAARLLERVRLRNRERIDWIVTQHAQRLGWPGDLARQYIGALLRFHIDDRARAGLDAFIGRAHAHGLVERSSLAWIPVEADAPCPR